MSLYAVETSYSTRSIIKESIDWIQDVRPLFPSVWFRISSEWSNKLEETTYLFCWKMEGKNMNAKRKFPKFDVTEINNSSLFSTVALEHDTTNI